MCLVGEGVTRRCDMRLVGEGVTCAWWGRGCHALGGGGGDMRLVGEGVTCAWWGRG